MSFEIQPVFC